MAKDLSGELMAGVLSQLKTSTALEALIAPDSPTVWRIYDYVPQDATFPYVRYGIVTDADYSGKTFEGMAYRLQVDVFSRERGDAEANDIKAAVIDALHDATITVSGAESVRCFFATSRDVPDPEVVIRHKVLEFDCHVIAT